MIQRILIVATMIFTLSALAGEKQSVNFNSTASIVSKLPKVATTATISTLESVEMETVSIENRAFTRMNISGVEMTRELGAPELPVRSLLLVGRPEDIQIKVDVLATEKVKTGVPYPVQAQDCRCVTLQKKSFQFNSAAYNKVNENPHLTYIGSYRGTPITRLDVQLASYDSSDESVNFSTAMVIQHNTQEFSFNPRDNKDYLLVMPEGFNLDFNAFRAWKEARGYTFRTLTIGANDLNTASIAQKIRTEYTEHGIDFVIIFGDETLIPQFMVSTSGSSRTPSDLKYFTFDGANDHIPDVLYSRIAVRDAQAATLQLQNSIDFEAKHNDTSGFQRIIGIASNEGSNPSDNEYVQSIEVKFNQKLGVTSSHFYQDDTKSIPNNLNSELSRGAFWLQYMGHGSGYSWPSMKQAYSVQDIKNIQNRLTVKSIIIDVACQNGRLLPNQLGTKFMTVKPDNAAEAFGAVAYFGGTVNISWHPPAVMAQGIAFEHMTKNFKHLGEALMAGQMYLTSKWNSTSDVIDNFEWYHLQGDPGLSIQY